LDTQGEKKMKARVLVLFLALALFSTSCTYTLVRGSGNVTSETRAVSGFSAVALSGTGDLIITQGNQEGLTIEAEDNILPYIETEVRGSTLYIGYKNNVGVSPTRPVKFALQVKDLNSASISGSGSIATNQFKTDHLDVAISGSGNADLQNLELNRLKVSLSGSGNIDAAGKTSSQEIFISGSGKYRGGDLHSSQASVTVSGSGNLTVWADESLDAHISGSGTVSYYGQPRISQSISGSGKFNSLGAK
jgi:hypothetical protein